MFGSIHLFHVFGISVRAHSSLFVFLIFAGFFVSPAFLVACFGCVLLHELGHSLVALRHGVPVPKITLCPLGGVASLAHMPREPRKEFEIVIAGPLVNIALAALATLLYLLWPNVLWGSLIQVNLVLGLFNLLPGFPMDGGRLLRAYLARTRPYLEATRIAVGVGRVVALSLGILGLLWGNLLLVCLAVFIHFAAKAEWFALQLESPTRERTGHPLFTRQPPTPSENSEPPRAREPQQGRGSPRFPRGSRPQRVVDLYNDGGVWRAP